MHLTRVTQAHKFYLKIINLAKEEIFYWQRGDLQTHRSSVSLGQRRQMNFPALLLWATFLYPVLAALNTLPLIYKAQHRFHTCLFAIIQAEQQSCLMAGLNKSLRASWSAPKTNSVSQWCTGLWHACVWAEHHIQVSLLMRSSFPFPVPHPS